MQLSRLQLQADELTRIGQKTTGPIQAPGAPVYGTGGFTQTATAAGQVMGAWVNYPGSIALANTPSSIHLDGTVENTNTTGIGVSNVGTSGFTLFCTATASGKVSLYQQYHTVGNCLLDLDHAAGTISHHCDTCEAARSRALALRGPRHSHVQEDETGSSATSRLGPLLSAACLLTFRSGRSM